MREMSQVIVYYDGTWKIKDLDCNFTSSDFLLFTLSRKLLYSKIHSAPLQ